jgi:hypothetical protein
MMRSDAGLEADLAKRLVGKARREVVTGHFLARSNGAPPVKADEVEDVLAYIGTKCCDRFVTECSRRR